MFTLLTRPISWRYAYKYFLKEWLKKVFFSRTYGPNSVIESILKWLHEVPEVPYLHNPKESNISDIVYVPVGVETLLYAIDLKKKWKIRKLIAWPNISIPISWDDVFFHPLIDIIIVPSLWVKNYFLSLGVSDERIWVIPAWVDMFPAWKKDSSFLIYKKDCPNSLFENVKNFLASRDITYEVIEYGKFQKDDYLRFLDRSKWLIYLQTSESQWIALHEAWMKDVPTFVWNRWYWEYKWKKWFDDKISAPYFDSSCGMFFDEESFERLFPLFLSNLSVYSPRTYSLENFTNKSAIKHLLQYLY